MTLALVLRLRAKTRNGSSGHGEAEGHGETEGAGGQEETDGVGGQEAEGAGRVGGAGSMPSKLKLIWVAEAGVATLSTSTRATTTTSANETTPCMTMSLCVERLRGNTHTHRPQFITLDFLKRASFS